MEELLAMDSDRDWYAYGTLDLGLGTRNMEHGTQTGNGKLWEWNDGTGRWTRTRTDTSRMEVGLSLFSLLFFVLAFSLFT